MQGKTKTSGIHPLFLVLIIFSTPILIFLSLYLNESVSSNTFFLEHGLFDFDKVYKALAISFSIVTILLLYFNFIQQRDEFREISGATIKANDLQIVLFEKQMFVNDYQSLSENFKLRHKSISSICHVFTENLNHLRSVINDGGNQLHKNIATNTLLHDEGSYRKRILQLIINLNKKISLLDKELNKTDALNIFTPTIPIELLELINAIYSPEIKFQIVDFDYQNSRGTSKDVLDLLIKVIQDTDVLKRIVNHYNED